MTNFLRRNFVLVLGVSLPLLLIAGLLLLHAITRMTATKPEYPVLYVSFDSYFAELFFDFDVDDAGRLEIGFRMPEENVAHTRRQSADATLALFDVRRDELSTYPLEAPDDPPLGERVEIDLPDGLATLRFSEAQVAPDGYRLTLSGYRGGGLFSELFGTGGRSRHHRLVRDGASFRVPDIEGSSRAYYDRFVGWVVASSE